MKALTMLGVCLALGIVSVVQAAVYQVNDEEWLSFGKIKSYLELVDSNVGHIEEDKFLRGNILFADGASIKSTGTANAIDGILTEIIAGSSIQYGYKNGRALDSLFGPITGFTQISADTVIVVDSANNCLRRIYRTTAMAHVSDFVGVCGSSGKANGVGSSSLWFRPHSVVVDKHYPSRLLVSDSGNNMIRAVQLSNSNIVSNVLSMTPMTPQKLVWPADEGDSSLFTTAITSIQKLNTFEATIFSLITTDAGDRQKAGIRNGAKDVALFTRLKALEFLHRDVYAVSDRHSTGLRLVNSYTGQVITLCSNEPSGNAAPADIPLFSCRQIGSPKSLLLSNGYLYIGATRKIYRMPVKTVHYDDLTTPAMFSFLWSTPTYHWLRRTFAIPTITPGVNAEFPSEPTATPTTESTAAHTDSSTPSLSNCTQPSCDIDCDYDIVEYIDEYGCRACECHRCGPVCAIACPHGNVLDDQGCPTCECNTGKTGVNSEIIIGSVCGAVGVAALIIALVSCVASRRRQTIVNDVQLDDPDEKEKMDPEDY